MLQIRHFTQNQHSQPSLSGMVPKPFFRVLLQFSLISPKKSFKKFRIWSGLTIIKNNNKLLKIIIVISTKYINKLLNILQQEKTNTFKYKQELPLTSKQ